MTTPKNTFDVQIGSNILINDVNRYKIIWIKNDACIYSLDFEEKKAKANSILILNPGQVFYVSSKQKDAVVLLGVENLPNAILKIHFNPWITSNHFNNSIIEFKGADATFVSERISNIIALFQNNNQGCCEIDNHINAIFLKVLNAKIEKQYRTTLAFDKLVFNYYKTDHLVANYASKLNITPKQLLLKLGKQGVNKPHTIIKKRLLMEAKKLLLYTNKPIKEICYELGFDDPAYFARFFKKNEGMTALRFRKQTEN